MHVCMATLRSLANSWQKKTKDIGAGTVIAAHVFAVGHPWGHTGIAIALMDRGYRRCKCDTGSTWGILMVRLRPPRDSNRQGRYCL
jgi:hypothetical protein